MATAPHQASTMPVNQGTSGEQLMAPASFCMAWQCPTDVGILLKCLSPHGLAPQCSMYCAGGSTSMEPSQNSLRQPQSL